MSYSFPFSFGKITFFSFVLVGICLVSQASFAQEEMGKVDSEVNKPSEKSNSDVSPGQNELSPTIPIINKNAGAVTKLGPVKKDPGLVGEGKKPESAPSTLNFNIFLYIVDKFKAD